MVLEGSVEDFDVSSWTEHESYLENKQRIDFSPREPSWNGDSDGYAYDVDLVANQLMEHAKKIRETNDFEDKWRLGNVDDEPPLFSSPKAYSSSYAASYDSDSSTGAPTQYLGCIGALCPKQNTGPKKSGPRQAGEGCEEMQQGITTMKELPGGGVEMRITLLAAGFVIGSGGASVHQIIQKTGATVQSWSEKALPGKRACRAFRVLGKREKIASAVEIIQAAVQRYKDLCEGKSQGIYVQRQQYVNGVEFCYQPPPKSKCPTAALLGKDRSSRSSSRRRGRPRTQGEGKPGVPESKRFAEAWSNDCHASLQERQGRSGCRSPPSVLPHEAMATSYGSSFRSSSSEHDSYDDIVSTVAISAVAAASALASTDRFPSVSEQGVGQDASLEQHMVHRFQQFNLFDGQQRDACLGGRDLEQSVREDLSSKPSPAWLSNEFHPCWLDSNQTMPDFLPSLRC